MITATIGGVAYPVLADGSYKVQARLDSRDRYAFIAVDTLGTVLFSKDQQVVVTDSVLGLQFGGLINTAKRLNLAPSPQVYWLLDCVSYDAIADRRTTNTIYTNQYSGDIVTNMLATVLSADGVTAGYASRRDTTNTDFAAGTLTNVIGALSVGDGNLELASAGASVTISEKTTADFAAGTLSNVVAANNALQPSVATVLGVTAVLAYAIQGAYISSIIYLGSQTIGVADTLTYGVWISGSSPEAKIGVDIIFTDGTYLKNLGALDQNGIGSDPANDLSGYATAKWYNRVINLSAQAGKTAYYVVVTVAGSSIGTYSGYLRNIWLGSAPSTPFFSTTLQQNPPFLIADYGYNSLTLKLANLYDTASIYRLSPAYSIDAVKILRSSFVSWNATTPTGSGLLVFVSIDGGAAWIACPNNMPIPTLLAGQSVVGATLQVKEVFTSTNIASIPSLNSLTITLNPSYAGGAAGNANYSVTTQANWNAGTLVTVQANAAGDLSTIGVVRNWDDGVYSSQSLYGSAGAAQIVKNKVFRLTSGGSGSVGDSRSRCDFAGSWGDFTSEIDAFVDNANAIYGSVFRTTGWVNNDGAYGYSAEIRTTDVRLWVGTNGGAQGGVNLAATIFSTPLTMNSWHRIKVVAAGALLKIYVDNILTISYTDYNYASGYVGIRNRNLTGASYTAQYDNFGIASTLSGTWTSPATSISALGTIGNSIITWDESGTVNPGSVNNVVQISIDSGATYQTCTSGGTLPGLPPGTQVVGKSILTKVTLQTVTAEALPDIKNLAWRAVGAFNATGQRVSPVMSLAPVGRVGSSLVAWNSVVPASTTLGIDLSLDGVAWTDVTALNGQAIPLIAGQPDPTIDGFDTNTAANYTSTSWVSGSVSTWTYDTTNSRMIASGGVFGVFVYNAISRADVDLLIDMDYADVGGLVWRYQDTSNYYTILLGDANSSIYPNALYIYKNVVGGYNLLASVAISFPRLTYHRFRMTMIGALITVYMDGVSILSYTDGAPFGAGKCGLINWNATSRFYQLRILPIGDDVSAKSLYARQRMTSTDPSASPQLLDITTSVHNPNIGIGTLIPLAAYSNTYVSANLDDISKKSDYHWVIDGNKQFTFQGRTAQPAPWILVSLDKQIYDLVVEDAGAFYSNRQILTGVVDTKTFTDTKIGDGQTRSWVLPYPLAAAPTTFTLNNQPVTFGVKGVDTNKQFYYAIGSNAIAQDSSQAILQQTDILIVGGLGTYTTSVTRDNVAGQTADATTSGTSGIVENVTDVSALGLNIAAAAAYGDTLNRRYGTLDGRMVKFWTYRTGLLVGQILTAFIKEHSLNDVALLITDIETTTVVIKSGAGVVEKFKSLVSATTNASNPSWQKILASVRL